MLKLIKRLKKGVSIVEVVIAIAVISIISVSAVSTLTYAKKAQEKNLRDYDLANTCNAVIDCFWLDNEAFLQKLESCGYLINHTTKTINRLDYSLVIEYQEDKSLTLTAIDNNGDEFYKISYDTQGGE